MLNTLLKHQKLTLKLLTPEDYNQEAETNLHLFF